MSTSSLKIESNMTLHKMLEDVKRVEIPIIQRDYAQGRRNVKEIRNDFLKDIFSHLNENKSMKLSFVYGTKNGTIYVPYDGQQRLTLIYLISLYLAAYSGEWEDIKILSRFSYYTRDYATAFCDFLTSFESNYVDGKKNVFQRLKLREISDLSEAIKNDSAFFGSWKYEPTVSSMIVVLQAIHEEFNKITEDIRNDSRSEKAKSFLNEIKSGTIFFDWCPIQASDNTYIKMNGRGKALSAFDNFKNTLYSELDKFRKDAIINGQKDKVDFLKNFEIKMDGIWTELFWKKRDDFSGKENYDIAPFMMNFLYYLFELRHFISSESFFFSGKESFKWIDEKNVVSFLTKFKDYCTDDYQSGKKQISIDDFIWISKILDIIESRIQCGGSDSNLGIEGYTDETQLLRELSYHPGKVASSRTVIVASLYYEYLVAVSEFDNDGTLVSVNDTYGDDWVELISRLMRTAAKFKARYDSLVRDKHILAGYANVFVPKIFENNNGGDLAVGAANFSENDLKNLKKYFDSSHVYSQLYEEIIKYQLIHKDASIWTNLLRDAETKLQYFENMIYFLIALSRDSNDNYDPKEFSKYLSVAQKIFNAKGVCEQNKFTAILLNFADYRISSGEGYSNSLSLCSNESTEGFSWRSFFDVIEGSINDQGKTKVSVIKSVFNYLNSYKDIDAAYNPLAINRSASSWRDVVICYPDVLERGSKHRIVYEDNMRWHLIKSEGVVKQVHSNSLSDSTDLVLYGLYRESKSAKVSFDNTIINFDTDCYVKAKGIEYEIKDEAGTRTESYTNALAYLKSI